MSAISVIFNQVRGRWHLLRAGQGVLSVLAVGMALLAALIGIDLLYHLTERPRLMLLVLGGAVLMAWAVRILLTTRRTMSDAQAALLIEGTYPSLQGLALAAAQFSGQEPANEDARLLHAALQSEAARQLGALDVRNAVDAGPLKRSAMGTGALLATGVLLVSLSPQGGHELTRIVLPWVAVAPTPAELSAQRHAEELEATALSLRAAAQRAAAEAAAPARYTISPGACEVLRGSSLKISAAVSRLDGPPQLRLRLSDGVWRVLPMTASADDDKQFWIEVEDLADDASYCVTMPGSSSATYPITVFDQVEVTEVHVDDHAPDYARLPVTTTKGGDIEALAGSRAHLKISANGSLENVTLTEDDGTVIPVTVSGAIAEADIPVQADGGYQLTAHGVHSHHLVSGLAAHYAIHALPDLPPTISLLYPAIDTMVHPLETINIAASVEDDVGLKEVRLCSTYGLEAPKIEKRSCLNGALALRQLLAQFTIDLKQRVVSDGDTIVFHLEVEDLKGQQATTDPFILTVRGYETMSAYANGNHAAGANGQLGAGYPSLLGALHDLAARKAQLTPEQFRAECDHLAHTFVYVPIAQ